MKRQSGVLMHISSLFGDYSIGSFGKSAKYFIDFLEDCGFSYWQVLPFCMADSCNSPYKSYSAFAGNPYFVDLETLAEKGLLTKDELDSVKQSSPYVCEYEYLSKSRMQILMKASERTTDREKIEKFISENKYLSDFCCFMALKEENSGEVWNKWTTDEFDEKILFMWKFIQYEFFAQWSKLKEYANDKGIKIIGDIPIYVDYDSSDVWAEKDNYLLDSDFLPTCGAGVPPDYFCPDGQMWGNPIYNWEYMKKNGFSWWHDRIEHMLSIFDGIRIDHFRGISSYWAVPAESENAKSGEWKQGPAYDFVDMVKKDFPEKLIIAEDLGDITPDVVELLDYSGFPGMRVMQFGFLSDDDSTHLPHNYLNNCIAYTGTHDNNTLLGYIWELDENSRKRLFEYCGYTGDDWNKGFDEIVRTLFASSAGTVIIPVQDLLGYGSDTRMNTPGKAEGNWQFRITKEQLDGINKEKYRNLNKLYKR